MISASYRVTPTVFLAIAVKSRVGKRLFACPPILLVPRGQTIEPFAHPTGLVEGLSEAGKRES